MTFWWLNYDFLVANYDFLVAFLLFLGLFFYVRAFLLVIFYIFA